MKYMININKLINTKVLMSLAVALTFSLSSCSDFELPEAGSIPDLTPPSAAFGAVTSPDNYLQINFPNLSASATDYIWDFGDGNGSTDKEPSNVYATVGQYTVTLVASDKLGAVSTSSQIVIVEEPAAITPIINEAGFEDGSTACGTAADGRDCWRISGGKIHGISGDEYSGEQSAKYDAGDPRVSYQALTVTPNTKYTVSLYYSMKETTDQGILRLSILGKAISEASEAADAVIASVDGTTQEGSKTWNKLTLTFDTGDTNTIALWIDSNNVAEARADELKIELAE